MSLANIIVPPFPDVPRAPGVPSVVRKIGSIESNIVMLAADAVAIVRMFAGPQWGIFTKAGAPLIIGDSVMAVDFRKEYRILDFPIEQGSFASYNKVETPFDIRITFASSGKQTLLASILSGGALGSLITGTDPVQANRTAFLKTMADATATLDLVDVITPEATYKGCNITHYDYRREARKGATMILVDVWLQEVRVSAKAAANNAGTDPINVVTPPAVTSPQNPASADPVSDGTVQATPITPTQASALPPAEPGNLATAGAGAGSSSSSLVPLYNSNGVWQGLSKPGVAPPAGLHL
jgi:hypothetical protein